VRLDLPSGGFIEFRDKLVAADKFAVQNSLKFKVKDGKEQEVSGGITNDMRNALLAETITAWSLDAPLPSQDLKKGMAAIAAMDIDDYNALQEEVEPLLEKVSFRPNRETPSDSEESS
jgi:hypothetical protein